MCRGSEDEDDEAFTGRLIGLGAGLTGRIAILGASSADDDDDDEDEEEDDEDEDFGAFTGLGAGL